MRKLYLVVLIFTVSIHAENWFNNYNLYFFGIVKHFKPTKNTHEGNVNYLAISKISSINLWDFENGFGTYVDSYNVRSYKIFTNISNEKYSYRIFTPIFGLVAHYKGKNYNSTNKTIILSPTLQLRIGENQGFFTNILIVPKIKSLTNGFTALEFGYKF